MKKFFYGLVVVLLLIFITGCNQESGQSGEAKSKDGELTPIKFALDWTPNTNHTGLYVAKEKGYFKEQGLDVELMLPGEAGANQLMAAGKADFGVSFQEELTQARAEDLPIVSIAAVIQHNTAAYASPVGKGITEPADFEGKVYGGYGTDMEKAVLGTIMQQHGADVNKVDFLNIGSSDYFTAVKRDIDFANIFYGWTGIEAETRGEELNAIYLKDFAEELDYYTPVLATNETMIEENPETVKAFMTAAAKGYEFAIDQPEEAADILLKHAPDLDEDLVKNSQKWLSPRYQDDAKQWGIQEKERWQTFTNWMVENEIINKDIDVEKAFTNEFLPTKE
ncbi:ABC transporter substrate-binding protein [Virgibacillus halodenitrificans]|uniref:ABC transporter substrate-binding protein n=1 Tax=Virgibacillus halodenitrificans TaxID=1482 RepID=A0AAC9J2F5_VIRHA|nr:ABC transporter substrate-binding protein [Virgibacillus halodenitrificans]APC49695.1 ABC transporter substrate-binding protein [Virgibacillus halodenitrificans]